MAFRQYPEPFVACIIAAVFVALAGCTVVRTPTVSESPPASEPPQHQSVPSDPVALPESAQDTPPSSPEAPPPATDLAPPSPLTLAMTRADSYYERGLQAMGSGNNHQAELEFDAALEALVDSGLAVSPPRLLGHQRSWQPSLDGWLSPSPRREQEVQAETTSPDPDEPTQESAALWDPEDVGTLEKEGPGDVSEVPEPDVRKYEFPLVVNDQVKTFLHYFQTKKAGVIGLAFERASLYLPMMRRIFREKGLPDELLNLAFIESALNPWATSRAKAAGIWQFMPATGRLYGMKVTWWVDERRDPEKATRGAADYLANLYRMFGTWDLALAAYNAGEGKVQRTINRQRTRDYWKLRLPKETRLYVPAFMAMTIISKEPERYGFSPPPEAAPLTEVVTLDHPADFRTLAQAGGTSIEQLRQLNPSLIRGATPPGASQHSLYVPAGLKDVLVEELAKIPPRQRVGWITHRIRAGETVVSIAKRYGARQQAILDMNGLKKRQGLTPGSSLLIPTTAATVAAAMANPSGDHERPPTRRANANATRHVVKKGETMTQIARAYGVSADDLQRANGLSRNASLRAGQTLSVPEPPAKRPSSSSRNDLANAVAGPLSASSGERRYTVKRGDTLTEIARAHRVSVEDLRRWNDLPRNAHIQPGQTLRIRVSSS